MKLWQFPRLTSFVDRLTTTHEKRRRQKLLLNWLILLKTISFAVFLILQKIPERKISFWPSKSILTNYWKKFSKDSPLSFPQVCPADSYDRTEEVKYWIMSNSGKWEVNNRYLGFITWKINRQNSLFTFSKTALINLRDLTKISLRRMVSVWGFHNFPVRQVMWYALILL